MTADRPGSRAGLCPGRALEEALRLEHEYRSLAPLVVEGLVGRPQSGQLRPVAAQLIVRGRPCAHAGRAAADLDLGVRVGAKVHNPGVWPFEAGVHVADDQTITVTQVQQRDRPRFAGAPPGRGQQQHRCPAGQREPPTSPAVQLSLERRDDPADGQHSQTSAA